MMEEVKMDENKYASPEAVDDGGSQVDVWRHKSRLRIMAYGLLAAAVGMGMYLALLITTVVQMTFFQVAQAMYVPRVSGLFEVVGFLAIGLFVQGMLLCLACGLEIAGWARWLVPASLACMVFIPQMPAPGLILWNFFLLRVSQRMEFARSASCFWIAFIPWGMLTLH